MRHSNWHSGGSAIQLTLDQRAATRDADAVFDKDQESVRRAAAGVADGFGWTASLDQ